MMTTTIIRFLLLLLLPLILEANTDRKHFSWKGRIIDHENSPVPYANVVVLELNRGGVSDEKGSIGLDHLPVGSFEINVTVIGYVTESVVITLPQKPGEVKIIQLQHTILEGSVVTVSVTGLPTDILHSERTVSVLEGDDLKRKTGQSLGETLKSVPGVQTISQGHAVSKPTIRGMSNQRIVILKDGIRMEGQQWGGHHTPETDILSVGRIEVVRGPMGLIYGSEALGGVIQLQSPDLRTLDEGGSPTLVAARSGFHANSQQVYGGFGLQKSWMNSAIRINAQARKSDDYAAPARDQFLKRVSGTSFEQSSMNFHFIKKMAQHELELLGSHYQEEQTLIGEGHWHNTGGGDSGTEPWYHVLGKIISPTVHQNLTLKGKWILMHSWIEYDAGVQHNQREGGVENESPAVDIATDTYSANVRWRHVVQDRFPGTIGFSHMRKLSKSIGPERLLPDYQMITSGVYTYYRWKWSSLTFTGGLRVDANDYHIKTAVFPDIEYDDDVDRLYFPVTSGSLGLVLHEVETPYSMALNIGTGWRPLNPYELYINGIHHGDWKIEIGNPALEAEHSINTDLILRHVAGSHGGEMSFFYNHLTNYVVSSPTGNRDSLTGIPIYQMIQGNARTYGSEMRLQYLLGKHVKADIGWDMMWGDFLESTVDTDRDGEVENALPDIYPARVLGGVTYKLKRLLWFDDVSMEIQAEHVFPQKHLAEYENVVDDGYGGTFFIEPVGYDLLDLSIHGSLGGAKRSLDISLGVDNLLNTQYYSHLSRYKGLVYNQGFNFHGDIRLNF